MISELWSSDLMSSMIGLKSSIYAVVRAILMASASRFILAGFKAMILHSWFIFSLIITITITIIDSNDNTKNIK
jgi:hypothetical protein